MSEDPELRLKALDSQIARTQAQVSACVRELPTNAEDAHLIAQRLPRLGSAALPKLREIMLGPSQPETVRILAAWWGFRGRCHRRLSHERRLQCQQANARRTNTSVAGNFLQGRAKLSAVEA
jgi:hypothetical protein